MISLRSVRKIYKTSSGSREILRDLSFDLASGSFTTLFGPNGCGKTTLLNILTGLDQASSGEILGVAELKGKIAYVFQDYRRSLLPWANVKDNILFPLKLANLETALQLKRLEEILDLAGIKLDLNQKVQSLSGGQAQLVCIFRALIINPKLLILDEPFAALDYERTLDLRELIAKLTNRLNLTTLFISHDIEEALVLGDQVVFLSRVPTVVKHVLKVDLPQPRLNTLVTETEFLKYKQTALSMFKDCCS